MPTYKYIYFNVRGRGEIPRLLMHAAGVPFEDRRYELSEWPGDLKKQMPFGQMPVIEIDGVVYPESMSISRYLAAEYGLAGKTPLERLKADYITEQTRTSKESIYKYFFEKDEAKKAELKKTCDQETTPTFLGYWEKELKGSTSGYLVGDELTIADLAVMDVLDFHLQDEAFKASFEKTYPRLSQNYNVVTCLPNIQKYRDSRPENPI